MCLLGKRADVVITDQVSNRSMVFILHTKVSSVNLAVRAFRLARLKLVFYCHYPDVLLCTDRGSRVRQLYRVPFDLLEQYTTGLCDALLVNSLFTQRTLAATFPNVKEKVHVLYPPVDFAAKPSKSAKLPQNVGTSRFFLSLNRYGCRAFSDTHHQV